MKWVILTGFLVLLGHGEGNVLRCIPNGEDASCATEEEKALPPSIEVVDEAPRVECLAGSEWESNCHYCRCSDAGTAECLKTACEGPFLSKNPEQPRPQGKECAIGSTWKNRCSTCVCEDPGYPVCNQTECRGSENEPENGRCAPYSTWKNDCNSCWCSPAGYGQCTLIGCLHEKDLEIIEQKTEEESIAEPPTLDDQDKDTDYTPDPISHNVLKRSVCKPNQDFQNECNSCKCSADGQTYTCTQAECLERDMTKEVEVFMESEGVDHIERHSVCKPQDTFYIGCNTCHCNYDGTDFSCTNKPCPLPDDVELFHELRLPSLKTAANQTCKAKAMFIKDCNICWCNEFGTDFFCTRKVCVPDLPDEPPVETPEEFRIIKKECRPFEVFELDCNMCRCNPDGQSFSCTRRACLDLVDKEDAKVSLSRKVRATPQESPKACQPGQEFRLDCNKCLCDNEGLAFSCTRIDCVAAQNGANARTKRETGTDLIEIETSCTAGGVFQAECNTCRCSADGRRASCTHEHCTPNHLDSALHDAEPDPGFRCNPGEQFKRDCNDCTCSADGRSTFCTLRLCDEMLPQSISP